jgi:hypothetical protein
MSGSDRLVAGIALVLAMWGLSRLNEPEGGSWIHPQGAVHGRVRILLFRASVGALIEGQKAKLCYGVENARTVRIAPGPEGAASQVYPSVHRCVEIWPQHTTHYTLMAIGFDGSTVARSLTLPVQTVPLPVPERRYYALAPASTTRSTAMPAARESTSVEASAAESTATPVGTAARS